MRSKLLLVFVALMIVGCVVQPNRPSPMRGEASNVTLRGYVEMCEREPESVLCEKDLDDE